MMCAISIHYLLTIFPNFKNFFFCQCHNPSLGLTTKVRVCKGAGQKGSPKVTFHAPRSVGEGERMNPHTPK